VARDALGPRPSVALRQAAFTEVLARFGYQPEDEPRCTRLRNCPFHGLAESHRELVCGMNEAFLAGVLDGLDLTRLDARLDPAEDRCCVVISR
jgi:predicted ArsR family transcriptional regulator